MLGLEAKIQATRVRENDRLVAEYWRALFGSLEFDQKLGWVPAEMVERRVDLEERVVNSEFQLHNTPVTLDEQIAYFKSAIQAKPIARIVLACAVIVTRSGIS